MTFAIGDACVDVLDLGCVVVCPVDCIYVGDRRAYIHPGECIDCGVCAGTCPVDAITAEGYGGPAASAVVADNLVFFAVPLPGRAEPVGSPGAAAAVGRLGVDPPRVAALPALPTLPTAAPRRLPPPVPADHEGAAVG